MYICKEIGKQYIHVHGLKSQDKCCFSFSFLTSTVPLIFSPLYVAGITLGNKEQRRGTDSKTSFCSHTFSHILTRYWALQNSDEASSQWLFIMIFDLDPLKQIIYLSTTVLSSLTLETRTQTQCLFLLDGGNASLLNNSIKSPFIQNHLVYSLLLSSNEGTPSLPHDSLNLCRIYFYPGYL